MEYKKAIILLVLAVFLLSITCVSASEIDNTTASEDTNTVELSADNDIIGDKLQTSEENDELALNDTDVLGADSGTYSDLAEEIGRPGPITLKYNKYIYYESYDNPDDIIIREANKVIDGNGAIIDMTESPIRAFTVFASGVTIKNLTIKNANITENGGAIYFDSNNSTVTNCNFIGNNVDRRGGAVYFNSYGTVTNCTFTNNTADNWGGAVCFNSYGTVTNCNFSDNDAYFGGAVFFWSDGTVTNCNFTGNKAKAIVEPSRGGAVYFNGNGTVTICNFEDNSAYRGGAIFSNKNTAADTCIFKRNSGENVDTVIFPPTLNVDNFTTFYGSGEKLTFDLKTNSRIPVTNGNISISVYFKDNDSWVGNYSCLSGEGWIPDLLGGAYYAIFYTEYAEFQPIKRTINVKYYINVTSVTTNNTTVNITAKTNLPNDIILGGKLLFILPNGTQIDATYGTNGTWWAEHTFDAYGEYKVNATYVGLDNVTINIGTITINKVNSTITLDNIVLDYGETKNVNVTTTGATGITAKIDESDAEVDGFVIFIPVLDAGNHTLTVTTITDDDHNPVTKEVNITVNKVNSTLTVDDIVFDYSSSGSTVVSLTGAEGVNATVVEQPKAVVKVKGTNITVSDLDAGTYTLTVTTIADKNHNNITKNATITVNKVNATLTVNDVELDYGESNVTVTTTGATGIKANINGTNVTVINNFTIPISGLGVGNYTLAVTTIADKNHNPVTKEVNITVNKVESPLTVEDIVFDYNSEGSGDVSFTGANEVTANVVNQPKAVVSVNGNKITVSGLAAGTYTLNVTTVPDENHTAVTKTATITVNKINSTLTLNDVELDYGDSINVTVTIGGATGITAKIDDVNVTVNNYTIPISGLGAGNHTLTVTTITDKNHNPVTKEANITVNKLSTEITINNKTLDLKVGDEVTGLANLTPAGAGNLTLTSSDEDLVYIDDDGIVIGNGQGQAIITVSFAGNENYAAAENKTITVNVALNDASVSVENATLNLKVDETSAINATIEPDTIMLKIKYTSSDDSVATVDKNGIVTAVGEGRAIITLEVGDDEIYAKNSTTVTVTVNKINTTADVSIPENITVGDNSTVNVVLPADATGNVTVKVDGEVVDTVPVKDGNAEPILPSMSAGNHTAEIAYSGDDKYNPASKTATITVNKDSTNIVADDVTATYKVNKYLVITLKDSKGKPLANAKVTVELNTVKNYTADENGQVKVKVSNLVPKTYNAKITFAGNNNYLGSDATAKVVVKKATPKITASNKMFKKTTKTKKYAITLKDNTGKPIKNAKVYLKVNGKTYKATTNSKGKATFKITKLSKKGTFKATVTYKGNKYYNKATKKVTIKVISAWKTISKGSKAKSTVKEIQRALKNNGYYLTAYGHYLKVDGIYWDYTVKAVKQFQKAKGLKVTGKVDEKTAKKLGII